MIDRSSVCTNHILSIIPTSNIIISHHSLNLPSLLLFHFGSFFLTSSITYLTDMAQRPHVPKFGNWDSENVNYTAYFENARKEQDASGRRFNPNDPEENPDLFSYMAPEVNHHVVEPPPSELYGGRQKEERHSHEEGPRRHGSMQRGTPDQHRSGNRKSGTSELSTDRSGSDRSLIHQNHHRTGSRQHKKSIDGSNSSYQSSARGTSYRSDTQPQKVASVPKFGAWDETDPKSGEGFTVIFNKVKQEKQVRANNFPNGNPDQNVGSNGQRHHGSSSSKPKRCCCLFLRSS